MNGLGFGIYFSGVVLLSLWMQQTLGFSIVLAGVLGAPPGLVAALMSPFLARLIQAFGSHVLLIIGFVAFAAAMLVLLAAVIGHHAQQRLAATEAA
jgi:DHA2 family lincomycin resistance protein-like MFS transporter